MLSDSQLKFASPLNAVHTARVTLPLGSRENGLPNSNPQCGARHLYEIGNLQNRIANTQVSQVIPKWDATEVQSTVTKPRKYDLFIISSDIIYTVWNLTFYIS